MTLVDLDSQFDAADMIIQESQPAENSSGADLDNKPAEENQEANQENNLEQPSPDTSETGEANPETKEPDKAELPDYLKDHTELLDRKGWKGSEQEILQSVIKGYSELEPHSQQVRNQSTLLQQRNKDLEGSILNGDLNQINEIRKANGLSEIQAQKSVTDRTESHTKLLGLINATLQGDKNSYNELNDLLTKESESLKEEAMLERLNGAAQGKMADDLKVDAHANFNKIQDKYPDAAEKIDSIYNDRDIWSLFQGLGINEFNMMRSPEVAEASYKLASLIHSAKNIQAQIDAGVKAELEKKANKQAAGTPGSAGGGAPRSQNNQDLATAQMQNDIMGSF